MSLVTAEDFADALKEKLGQQIDVSEIEAEIRNLEDQKRRTEVALRKRSEEKDTLDIDDPFYDDKYEDISRSMDKLYYKRSEIVAAIEDHKTRIRAIEQNKVSRDSVYQSLLYFAEVYDAMSDSTKREFMPAFIERIEIFKEKQPNGRRVREIVFNFPVSLDGGDVRSIISRRQKTLVETVVLLRREHIDDYIAVDLDISMLDSNVGAHASYPEIKAYVLEHTGLHVSSLYIAQIKHKCGIIDRENYNHGSGTSRVPICPQEKEDAILDAFRHFGMI